MAVIPVGSILQVTYEYDMFNQSLMNTLHYVVDTTGGGVFFDQLQEVADYFGDVVTAGRPGRAIHNYTSESLTMLRTRAQVIAPIRYSYRSSPVFQAGLRGVTTTCNTDAVLTKRCDLAGRKYRGNFFLPGIAANDTFEGVLTGAYKTLLEVNFQWLDDKPVMPVSGMILEPVIFHRINGAWDPVTDYAVQDQVRVMTRRTVGRGI